MDKNKCPIFIFQKNFPQKIKKIDTTSEVNFLKLIFHFIGFSLHYLVSTTCPNLYYASWNSAFF